MKGAEGKSMCSLLEYISYIPRALCQADVSDRDCTKRCFDIDAQVPVSSFPGSESLGELVGDLSGVHLDGGDDVDEDVVAVRLLSHRVAVRNLQLAKDLQHLRGVAAVSTCKIQKSPGNRTMLDHTTLLFKQN